MSVSSPSRVINIGVIGCGEVSQVVHVPTLAFMSSWFHVTYLCDVSAESLRFCAAKLNGDVQTTSDAAELCSSSRVDAVLIATADEYHTSHCLLALQHNKHVFVEKPLALTMRDAMAIGEAEKPSKGNVMVGYMRRYAAPFEDAVREIGGMDKILYARVRDIIGPNSYFIDQSGTFPQKFNDFSDTDVKDKDQRAKEMVNTALHKECGITVTPESTLSYESGFDNVPRFDAHLEVYSSNKTVRVQYDTPFVKGLPVTMHVSENADGAYKESTIRKSYEDPYTQEMKAFWEMVVEGKTPKTTVQDAMQDLEIFAMAMRHEYSSA
ncbi:hypothetical protein ACHAP5_011187 [Fusarium lateritium]